MDPYQYPSLGEASLYHIGDVSTLTGIMPDALRAWERVGLISPRRSLGGVRQFTEDDIARIRLIARTLQQQSYHDEPSLNSFILAIFALTLLTMRRV